MELHRLSAERNNGNNVTPCFRRVDQAKRVYIRVGKTRAVTLVAVRMDDTFVWPVDSARDNYHLLFVSPRFSISFFLLLRFRGLVCAARHVYAVDEVDRNYTGYNNNYYCCCILLEYYS